MSSLPSTASVLRDRFIDEQGYINRYVQFLQYKTAIFESEIRSLVDLLRKHNLADIENKRDWSLWRNPYSYDELRKLNEQVQPLIPDLTALIEKTEKEFASIDEPPDLRQVDVRSAQGELIEYLLEALNYDASPDNINAARQEMIEQIRLNERELAISGEEPLYTDDMVDYAVKSAIHVLKSRQLSELESLKEKIAELDITVRMSSPDAEINVLRQGFIVLMTIFDATIFDIMRIALRKDFFRLVSIFGKQEKIAFRELNNYASFEEFRDEIIEEQLKAKYIKDLLFILEHLGVTCVDGVAGDVFIQLIETVQRRNIHIHNRGRVDEKYLERDDIGRSKYNFYNLALNDVAEIDSRYLESANRLCRNCVVYVADWADSLP